MVDVGQNVHMLHETTTSEMSAALQAMRSAHFAERPVSASVREDRLHRLLILLDRYAERFVDTLDHDFAGRSRETSLMNDLLASAESIRYAKKQLRGWMRPERRNGVLPFNLFGAKVEVQHVPKGVVGILGTWNVPLFTILSPLAFVLAAGNRALLKPSELTPATSALLREAINELFPSDEIEVVLGGAETAAAFSALPFDHLVLTGSDRVARFVAAAAANHLTPLTLELGGKSPVIVGTSADLETAARRILIGKIMNSGQICVAPDTVYVPRARLPELLAELRTAMAQLQPGGARESTAIINDNQLYRLRSMLEELAGSGVDIVTLCGSEGSSARQLPLTVVIDPPETSRIACTEIFGPILQIRTYDQIDEVIVAINARPSPLALYYFGRDSIEETQILGKVRAGGVTINDVLMHVAASDAPFGGIGGSGYGCYHGREGFVQFSHALTVFRSGWWDPRRVLGLEPPYGSKTFERLRKVLRP